MTLHALKRFMMSFASALVLLALNTTLYAEDRAQGSAPAAEKRSVEDVIPSRRIRADKKEIQLKWKSVCFRSFLLRLGRVEDLEAALEQFREIVGNLGDSKVERSTR